MYVYFTFLCIVIIFAVEAQESDSTVRSVILIARHGARTCRRDMDDHLPDTTYLTMTGKRSNYNLGTYVRQRYPNIATARYNATNTIIRSSSSERCLQSAGAFMRGMYPHPLDFPFVDYTPAEDDFVLRPTQWPGLELMHISETASAVVDRVYYQSKTSSSSISPSNLTTTFTLDKCFRNEVGCALLARDLTTCDPQLQKYKNPVLEEMAMRYAYESVVNYANDTHVRNSIGTLGYKILMEGLKQSTMKSFNAFFVQEHTLVSVYHTLGYVSSSEGFTPSDFYIPVFGEVLLLEITTDSRVRILRGKPTQQDNTQYTFTVLQEYTSLSAFTAFVATRGPGHHCHVPIETLRQEHCYDTPNEVPVDDHCRRFRLQCPEESCASRAEINPRGDNTNNNNNSNNNYGCVSVLHAQRYSFEFFAFSVIVLFVVIFGLIFHLAQWEGEEDRRSQHSTPSSASNPESKTYNTFA
eukprot:PhF_6_TR21218/c0_g1_i2/m.30651